MGDSKSTQIVSVSKLIICLKSPKDAVFVSFVTKNWAHGFFVSSSAEEHTKEKERYSMYVCVCVRVLMAYMRIHAQHRRQAAIMLPSTARRFARFIRKTTTTTTTIPNKKPLLTMSIHEICSVLTEKRARQRQKFDNRNLLFYLWIFSFSCPVDHIHISNRCFDQIYHKVFHFSRQYICESISI